ncbi:MAG: pyridoxal 5'-phosphate synthase [Sphingobium sp.]|nr:pyridoxal 5'-phosphate synthase [Sphingobium sp.]
MAAADDMAEILALFRDWLFEAEQSGVIEPSAMILATASAAGLPSARMVLLKQFDERGFAFYTNLRSRKAGEITENPYAALFFSWSELDREVHIAGRVEPVGQKEADAYFASRPVLSRIGAWASRQSRPLSGRPPASGPHRLVRRYLGISASGASTILVGLPGCSGNRPFRSRENLCHFSVCPIDSGLS